MLRPRHSHMMHSHEVSPRYISFPLLGKSRTECSLIINSFQAGQSPLPEPYLCPASDFTFSVCSGTITPVYAIQFARTQVCTAEGERQRRYAIGEWAEVSYTSSRRR